MSNFSEKVSFIWSVADLLRGPYKPHQYGRVILPLTVLLFFDQIKEEAVSDTAIKQAAMVNSLENFGSVFDKALEDKFIDRMDQNQEIFARYMNDKNFQRVVADWMGKRVYEQIRADNPEPQAAQGATV